MHDLSMTQALWIWSQLEQAYYGANRLEGNLIAIDAYRLQSADPGIAFDALREKIVVDQGKRAARSLKALLDLFCEMRNCRAEANGKDYRAVLSRPLLYRCLVRVIPIASEGNMQEKEVVNHGNRA